MPACKLEKDFKKILKVFSLSIFLLSILVYAFFVSKDLIFGVKIKNVNITDGIKITDSILNITGNSRNAQVITLNDRPISIDQKGNFDETIALLPGYNVISIKATDEFGNHDEKYYKLMY